MAEMKWTVPVILPPPSAQRREMSVVVKDGEVLLVTPFGAQMRLPVTSDEVLCEAIRQARAVANGTGQGLT